MPFRFLSERFSTEYLSNVTRKRLSCDVVELLCPEPVYRMKYLGGHKHDVFKRVKKMIIPAGVKTFFFKLHTETLPV